MARPSAALFTFSQAAVHATQQELGKKLGISRRTAQRWVKHGVPSYGLEGLARLVHPHDAVLAAEIAAAAGTTLQALGIGVPAEPAPVAPALPPGMHAPLSVVVDAVVCAAADAMDAKPREVRPALHAAVARARELGLGLDDLERELRPRTA